MEAAPPTTLPDRWGYPIHTTSAPCIAAINAYYDQFLAYGRKRSLILDAVLHDPACVLANALAAHFLASRNPDKAAALLAAAFAAAFSATAYERAVLEAVSCLVRGGAEKAALDRHFEVANASSRHANVTKFLCLFLPGHFMQNFWNCEFSHDSLGICCMDTDMQSGSDTLLKEYPRDLVSLKRAQILYFYMGRPDLSLGLVEQVLPQNPDQSYIYGMLAFPLLEVGSMAEAEKAARKAFDINKLDIWSHHNICHVLQYQCGLKEAVDFMKDCSSLWSTCSSFMYTHNWWHVAVCYVEGHSPTQKVLDIYDHYIWGELQKDDAEYGEVYINAVGLLFKLYVRGQAELIKDRLAVLVKMFEDESTWNMEWLLDLQGLWALSNCSEINKAEDLLKSMKSRFESMSKEKQHRMQSVIPLTEAMYEYGRRNYQKVLEILGPDFDAINYRMIGASGEQLDVFNEFWYDVLLRTGHTPKAIELLKKQVTIREGIPFLWRLLEKAYLMEGRVDDANYAGEKAKALEGAYF